MVGNLSEWYEAAKKAGIDWPELIQDKTRIYEDLERLELPHPDALTIDGAIYEESRVNQFLADNPGCFCRLVPKKEGIRPYRLSVTDLDDFQIFISGYNLEQYIIQLVERGEVIYSGSIISTPDLTVTELVEGTGEDLFHGIKTPISAYVDPFLGVIRYRSVETDEYPAEKQLIYRALKHIGGPKNPFPGYYEYDVWNDNGRHRIVFRNYTNEKPFTQI